MTAVPPRVSVVVATNRGGPYLHEAVASVRTQTYPDVELLVVDDGSPEPEVIRRVVEEAGGRLVRQAPAGVSVARNVGVARTTGELLVFLDDDDRWHPERLERQVRSLEDAPDAVVSYCGMRTIDTDGREISPADQRQVRDVHEVLRRVTGIFMGNTMLRRGVFDRVGGFHPALRLAEDLDLVLRAAHEGPFVFVEGPLVDYRAHGANTTRRRRELATAIDRVVRLHLQHAQSLGRDDFVADHRASLAANARYTAWTAARSARALVATGRLLAAAREIGWAARTAPTAPAEWLRKRLSG